MHLYGRASKAPYRMTFSLPRLADVATLKQATAALVEHMSSYTTSSLPAPTTTSNTVSQQQQVVVQQPLQLEHVYTVDSTYYSPESKKVFMSETITDEYVMCNICFVYTVLFIYSFTIILLYAIYAILPLYSSTKTLRIFIISII